MASPDFYFTIDKPSIAEFKDRGSRFVAYAYPVESINDFKLRLADIKKEHPKATHHCFAYRLGTDAYNFRVSDNGEPSGSAGRPILGQIDSRELTNIVVFVVRYFGGSLLGIPGLISAYKTATALALQTVPIIQKPVFAIYNLQFDYTQMNRVMLLLKQYNCVILKQELQLFCSMDIGIIRNKEEEVLNKFQGTGSITVRKV
ncbi:MAG: YigZ family protein [Bacteroidetes bacterium]|nr:YigZ family protein [Bacteroidota bacterium]